MELNVCYIYKIKFFIFLFNHLKRLIDKNKAYIFNKKIKSIIRNKSQYITCITKKR